MEAKGRQKKSEEGGERGVLTSSPSPHAEKSPPHSFFGGAVAGDGGISAQHVINCAHEEKGKS